MSATFGPRSIASSYPPIGFPGALLSGIGQRVSATGFHIGIRAEIPRRFTSFEVTKNRMFIPYVDFSGERQIVLASFQGTLVPWRRVLPCRFFLRGDLRQKKFPLPGEKQMRITSSLATTYRFRFAQIIAMSGVIAIAACQDATAPEETELAAPSLRMSQAASDELGTLSSSLDDMTGWSLAALPDANGRANIVGILNGLKGHLASGKLAACQQDVDDARAFLGTLSQNEQTEIGGVGATLDLIQSALDKASQ
jgi:hypothetical protein